MLCSFNHLKTHATDNTYKNKHINFLQTNFDLYSWKAFVDYKVLVNFLPQDPNFVTLRKTAWKGTKFQ